MKDDSVDEEYLQEDFEEFSGEEIKESLEKISDPPTDRAI